MSAINDLDARIARHSLTSKGRALVAAIRNGIPARQVRGGSSVTVRYPSAVMGRTMHLESRGFELPVAIRLDTSKTTHAFYPQPCRLAVPLPKVDALRAVIAGIFPDFFAIEEDESNDESGLAIGFIEAKSEERMRELHKADPERFVHEDGRWHDLLLEEFLRSTYGLDHRILTDANVTAAEVRNANYEEDYLLSPIEVAPAVVAAFVAAVQRRPGISGAELREECTASIDTINQVATDRVIWYPRHIELLKDLDRVHFYPSALLGEALLALPAPRAMATGRFDISIGASFRWGEREYRIANCRDGLVDCLADGAVTSIKHAELERLFLQGQIEPCVEAPSLASAVVDLSPKAQRRFVKRAQALLDSTAKGHAVSSSARRWQREYDRRSSMEGHGIRALVPNFRNSGRWGPRIAEVDRDLAIAVLTEQYLTPEQRKLVFAYGVYCNQFRSDIAPGNEGARPMSRTTFTRLLRERWTEEQIERARKGYKAANQAKLRGPLAGGRIDDGLPTKGDRAWERVHIDHSELDVFLVDSVTRETSGRVWGTPAIDGFSGETLEVEFSLNDPSKRLPMQLFRKLVRKYHRLPRTIIVDNGSEFRSEYFQTFCATYGIRIEYRPPATPRAGSPVEGFFNRFNVFLHTSKGNARPGQNPRSLDKNFAPAKRAVWTLLALEQEYKPRAIALLNAAIDPVRGISHHEIYTRSIQESGLRLGQRIAYDQAFLALSALPRKKDLQVTRDGIVVGKVAYWCEAFRDPGVQGSAVPVRDEPFDISRKYAFVKGAWNLCRTERFRVELEGRTDVEIEVASKELAVRLKREPELDEVVDFLLDMQGIERRLADEQRATRKRSLRLTRPPTPPSTGRSMTPPRQRRTRSKTSGQRGSASTRGSRSGAVAACDTAVPARLSRDQVHPARALPPGVRGNAPVCALVAHPGQRHHARVWSQPSREK